ncbi:hypothetical protein ACFQX6_49585 [Streptosporangium lutulentum]
MSSTDDSASFGQDAMLSGHGERAACQHPQIPGLSTVAGQTGAPIGKQGAAPAVPRQRPRPDKATRKRLRKRVHVAGVAIDPMTESEVVDHVIAALKRGEGGHIVTPNVDISRIVARDPEARRSSRAPIWRWRTVCRWCGRRSCSAPRFQAGSPAPT